MTKANTTTWLASHEEYRFRSWHAIKNQVNSLSVNHDPLESASLAQDRGLLVANHGFTTYKLSHSGIRDRRRNYLARPDHSPETSSSG